MLRARLLDIRHDRQGFEQLVELVAQTEREMFETIEIDMSRVSWFDADMAAPFGAILYRVGRNLNTIELTNIQPRVGQILAKNGFLSQYGRERIPDTYGTTLPYRRFGIEDDKLFAEYVERNLVQRSELPTMSTGLLKRFRESIYEIFSNAVIHSETKQGIFSCGQLFPNRHRIAFSVADLGIGIRANILKRLGLDLAPEEAISWAMQAGNTTKRGPIPGGLGLKLLSEFITLNEGCLIIVSDAGFWELRQGRVMMSRLAYAFPGTVVNLDINTADTRSYSLASETQVPLSDIF